MAKRRFASHSCPNCGTEYHLKPELARFCPACGQENHELNMPFRHVMGELFETVLHFDTKSVRTIRALVFSPGLLTTEFVKGRRASYVTPIRLYIFISFLFFLLLSISSREGGGRTAVEEASGDRFNITFYSLNSRELYGLTDAQIDSLMQARSIELTPTNRYIVRQVAKTTGGGGREFVHTIVRNISYMMFLLMPFLGYLVYLFHRKREVHYIGTLVFSLHFHSFTFLTLAVLMVLSRIPYLSFVYVLTPFVSGFYLYASLRRIFGRSRFSTLVRTTVIGILHLISVAVLFLVTVFGSVLVF
jgi:hypothetical protein